MNGFDDRRRGFEDQYRREQELAFRRAARRNRLFGKWAAGRLQLSGPAADQYAESVVAADFQEPGDEDVLAKIGQDLSAKSIPVTSAELRAKLDECGREAQAQIR